METTAILWLFPIVAAFAIYLLKRNVDEIDKSLLEATRQRELLRTEINRVNSDLQNVKNEYLHKNDFREFKIELRGMFDELKQDIRGLKRED